MSDVARTAGVSIKTVSRVVNDEPGVNPDTADRVRTAIEALGFRRNDGARKLRTGQSTGTVGLVLEDVANPFYSALTRAVEEVARGFGHHLLTGSSAEDPDRERDLTLEFCARRVDGLLIVPAGQRHGYLLPEMRAGTPVVFVDRPAGDIEADTVLVDNAGGAAAAVGHLVSCGHTRIGFLGDAPDIFTAGERLRGFRAGCARAGLPGDLVLMGPHSTESVSRAMRGPLSEATAVICGNNRITVLLLRFLADGGTRPALVGFDDFELADLLDPPVTVLAHDIGAMGRTAAELLFARLRGDTTAPRRIVLPVRLVPRGSGEVRP